MRPFRHFREKAGRVYETRLLFGGRNSREEIRIGRPGNSSEHPKFRKKIRISEKLRFGLT